MKKTVVVLLGLICLLMVGKVWADCTFSDIDGNQFYNEITGICELGITTGYPDGTFRPDNNVTRQAMAAFLWRTIDILKPENPVPNFDGEVCFSFYKTEDTNGSITPEGPYVLRSKVNNMGGGYFTIQGYVEFVDEQPHMLGGYAVEVEDKIIVTLTGSKDQNPSSWRDIDNIQVQLDKLTLDGIWWGMTLSFDTSERGFDIDYAAGTIEFTTCP